MAHQICNKNNLKCEGKEYIPENNFGEGIVFCCQQGYIRSVENYLKLLDEQTQL